MAERKFETTERPMSKQTQMAAAFSSAGYQPPEQPADRLQRMMREAIHAGGPRADTARDYFIRALTDADDAALLWELFADVRMAVIGRLFAETLTEMRAEKAPRDADGKARQVMPQGQIILADPSATHADGGAISSVPQGQNFAASPSAPNAGAEAIKIVPQGHRVDVPAPAARPPLTPQNPSRKTLGYAARDAVARLSILQTFRKIGGAPLGEVTGAEARAWLHTHDRDGRFVRLVSDQVPDELTIGAIIPPEEAERLYRLATEAANA